MRNLVNVPVEEAAVCVKMLVLALTLSHDFVWNLPLEVHEELEHVVVGLAREHDLARVQLIEGRPRAPQVDSKVIFHS